ncbi:hypothetical protein SEA_SHAM_246 [Streptomyces phage Sham]|nr:hypothetical protein SEA_SHAM_246 [Streptomyces phage Sham]
MDTRSWYEIRIVNFSSGNEIGVVNQPVPPNIGDKVNLHFRPGNVARVISRTFDYSKGLYVTIEVAYI